jgi:hypothetical protein
MRSFFAAGWAAVLMSGCAAGAAADCMIIANPALPAASISVENLREVFLATQTFVGSSHVEPVLAKAGAAHEAFLKKYLGKSDASLKAYYKTLVFTGRGSIPRAFASDTEVMEYVARTKGAIGYVSAGTRITGVKTLEVR